MQPKIVLLCFGFLSLACNDVTSPGDLQGTWAVDFRLPGASLVLDLTQADRAIAGGGSYAIEAGRAGTLQVSGSYDRPGISLTIVRDFGLTQIFTGTVVDARHMTGAIADGTGRSVALTFIRR